MNTNSSRKSQRTRAVKALLIGVGNPILMDDGIGIHILRELEKKYSSLSQVDFEEVSIGGLSLVERFIGYTKVIMIDALALEDGTPGKVHKLSIDDFHSTVHSYCVHDCNLATAYEVLKKELGPEELPQEVVIIAIEAEKLDEFGETLSAPVQQAIPEAVALVEQELADLL